MIRNWKIKWIIGTVAILLLLYVAMRAIGYMGGSHGGQGGSNIEREMFLNSQDDFKNSK